LGDKEATIKAVKFETGHSKRIQQPIEMYKVACLVLALFAVAYAIPSAYGKNQKNWRVIWTEVIPIFLQIPSTCGGLETCRSLSPIMLFWVALIPTVLTHMWVVWNTSMTSCPPALLRKLVWLTLIPRPSPRSSLYTTSCWPIAIRTTCG